MSSTSKTMILGFAAAGVEELAGSWDHPDTTEVVRVTRSVKR
jgi:hypothetical protein